jgi:predicted RNase H-like HicB family nuclease
MDWTMRLTAVFEYDPKERVWNAHAAENPRILTWARTLTKARAYLDEAASLWVEEGENLEWAGERFVLPDGGHTGDLVAAARREREQAAAAAAHAQETQVEAVRRLRGLGLSLRDAASVLGVSHPRVVSLTGR